MTLPSHCLTLRPDHYKAVDDLLALYEELRIALPCREDHYHRRWEYSVILDAIRRTPNIETILEVGSGGSLFAPMAVKLGYQVVTVDPHDSVRIAEHQAHLLQSSIPWIQANYEDIPFDGVDVIVAISVIEHVEHDLRFIGKMAKEASQLIAFTTDFAPNGLRQSPDHLRTYDIPDLERIRDLVHPDWSLVGAPLWSHEDGTHVFKYTFASFVASRTVLPDPVLDLPEFEAVSPPVSRSGRRARKSLVTA